ncbi:type-F conjugative transfer system pilin assembly protein TrbC [Erwinia sp. JH02]|uniref:type-F conjugative transfer system pilin assembly protein TrbC n=1 Tax=Erwinia sp. JH02 TaxID=2733394 RepID=UPI0014877680|nr:type-F conjugative transfer system pilin assembly protein TrbC [Erwinia sp. JH02]NNS09972.1 type-F conjugative transfer system pilin assembly protein TrbC [Erwinia sp. JH02]
MNAKLTRALCCSALLACAFSTFAAEQPSVNPGDVAWMKQQQKELKEFQNTLMGQTVTLPPAQQDRVNDLQAQIAASQSGDDRPDVTPPAVYFVSFSIPPEGLKPMLSDARRFGIPATIRGLIDNDFRKTASAMFDIAKEDNTLGVQIEPTLYQKYNVSAVPALVVTCPGHFDIIRGSLPLAEALKNVAERGECGATARQLLENAK